MSITHEPGENSVRSTSPEIIRDLDAQIATAQARIAALVPATVYGVLTTTSGWGTLRAGTYAAAVGNPTRWPSHAQIYRASGLTPAQYESAGRRRDGAISREGSVELRIALIDLGVGLWHQEPAARAYAARLRERGKPSGIIRCALARRANKIAFAMVRDQTVYDTACWPITEYHPRPFPTAAGHARLAGTEGRNRRRPGCDAPPRGGDVESNWRPAFRLFAELERRQMTPHPPVEVA